MIINHEERTKIRDKDREILKAANRDRDEIIARKLDEIQTQYEKIEKQMQELKDQKSELLSGPITRGEILENAKAVLKMERKDLINSFLGKHLRECQLANAMPFNSARMGVHLIPPERAWKLFFFAVDEKDLEEAAAGLPDIGMSIKEREAKISEIDKEISRLSNLIKDDLAALQK